jgi:hypothetical protein
MTVLVYEDKNEAVIGAWVVNKPVWTYCIAICVRAYHYERAIEYMLPTHLPARQHNVTPFFLSAPDLHRVSSSRRSLVVTNAQAHRAVRNVGLPVLRRLRIKGQVSVRRVVLWQVVRHVSRGVRSSQV